MQRSSWVQSTPLGIELSSSPQFSYGGFDSGVIHSVRNSIQLGDNSVIFKSSLLLINSCNYIYSITIRIR